MTKKVSLSLFSLIFNFLFINEIKFDNTFNYYSWFNFFFFLKLILILIIVKINQSIWINNDK